MTNNDELVLKLKAAAEKATALNLDSAAIQRGDDGYYVCPVCCGEGEVEAKTDFCNIDGVALGVQFYGIGEHHGAAEEYFRAVAPANILALLAERTADKAENSSLRKRVAELEAAATCKFMPVGVMSQSKFENLDDGSVRFIALWPRPGVAVSRKRPDDGVLVYAKVAGIKLEVEE